MLETQNNTKLPVAANIEYNLGMCENADLQLLLEKCRQFIPNYKEELIRLAFNYCVIAHEGKLRKSGKKYYTHPLSVAFIVIKEIPLDNESVVVALLHNVLDESDIYTYEDLRFTFGSQIVQIIEGVTRIKFVESQHIDRPDQIDNYRKLLLTLFSDIRIILIKLADKLDNMRTLQYVSADSQTKIAQETLDIYVPFANRFGLTRIKFELEDLAFKFIKPEAYKHIEDTIKGTHNERVEYVERFKEPIVELLEKEGLFKKEDVKYRINGRAKNVFSIYNKTILRQKPVEELYDIFAIRIILDTDNSLLCYYVYGIVANYYKPVPETFKDYISSPKENGYSSLHTAVAGPNNRIVEVQIRTEQMHQASEVGVAAHFRYKSGVQNSILEDTNLQHWLDEVRDIFDKIGDSNSPKLHSILSNNMLKGSIYVFTPKDEFLQLPKGATALDFAFEIHSDIGLNCIGAKINGKFCPINYILKSGDKVEIITSKNQSPSKDWLDFVITPKAHSKLLSYFKEQLKSVIAKGKNIWDNKNEENGFKFTKEEMAILLRNYHYDNENHFFEAIGRHQINLDKIYQFIMINISSRLQYEVADRYNNSLGISLSDKIKLYRKLDDNEKYGYVFEECCSPLPGDSIFGISENKDIISIHNSQCLKYKKLQQTHPQDIIILDWEYFPSISIFAKLRIIATDRENLIEEIINVIMNDNKNQMTAINYDIINSIFTGEFSFKISIDSYISEIIIAVENINGVKSAERVNK